MTTEVKQTITLPCLDCGEDIELDSTVQEGQKLTCPTCWAYLEVIETNPLRLGWDTFGLEDEEDE